MSDVPEAPKVLTSDDVIECHLCGAVVLLAGQDTHNEFHDDIDRRLQAVGAEIR